MTMWEAFDRNPAMCAVIVLGLAAFLLLGFLGWLGLREPLIILAEDDDEDEIDEEGWNP